MTCGITERYLALFSVLGTELLNLWDFLSDKGDRRVFCSNEGPLGPLDSSSFRLGAGHRKVHTLIRSFEISALLELEIELITNG